MNAAIVGSGRINEILKIMLFAEGINPTVIESLDDMKDQLPEVIVITEEYHYKEDFIQAALVAKDVPGVLLLDYPIESSTHSTAEALAAAINIAKMKKQVYFLSKFVRTAGSQSEILYRRARKAGVIFIKYDEIRIDYKKDTGTYNIEAFDGYDLIKISSTAVVIDPGPQAAGEINHLAKGLKLRQNADKTINIDQSMLQPFLTSRNGIYFFDASSFSGREEERRHLSAMIANIKSLATLHSKNPKHAIICAEKCVLCYTCYRACPHFAMIPDAENPVMKNVPESCRNCGICASVCPADAIRMDEGVQEIQIIDSKCNLNNTTHKNAHKTLKIMCCENSAEIALKRMPEEYVSMFDRIDIEPAACGGAINVEAIIKSLVVYDKVLVAVCVDGACRHFDGNRRAENSVRKAQEMLKVLGMDQDRVVFRNISPAMTFDVRDELIEMLGMPGN